MAWTVLGVSTRDGTSVLRFEQPQRGAGSDGSDATRSMADEGEAILRLIAPSETLWLLERTRTELTSEESTSSSE